MTTTLKKLFKRLFKLTALVLVIVPAFILLAFSAAISLIDFNQYKPMIEQEVSAKTGRTLTIDGEISAHLMPLKLSIGASRLAQAENFDQQRPFLAFEKVNLRVALMDLLLAQKLRLLGVELFAPTIHLQVNQDGMANWRGLASRPLDEQAFKWVRVSSNEEVVTSRAAELAESWGFQLNNLAIHDGFVEWRDARNDEHIQIVDFEMMAFDLQLGQPFAAQLQGQIKRFNQPRFYVFNQQGKFEISADLMHWQVHELNSDMKAHWANAEGMQDMRVGLMLKNANWQRSNKHIEVEYAKLKALDSEIEFGLSGQYGAQLDLNGQLKLLGVSLRQWLDYFNIDYPDLVESQALQRIDGQFDWRLNTDQWRLEQINLKIDQSQISGYVAHQMLQQASYQFDLKIDRLNVDYYAARKGDAFVKADAQPNVNQASPAEPSATDTYLPIALPISTLRESHLQGQLQIGQLQVWQGKYQTVEFGVNAQYGKIDIAPMDAQLYGGEWRSQLTINVNGDTPAYQIKGRLNDIDILAFLNDVANYDSLEGQLLSRFDIRSSGSNLAAIKYHLNGQFSAELRQGAYRGIDVNKLLLGQESAPHEVTLLQQVNLSGQLVDGVFHIQQAQLSSERFNAQAFGKVNIPQNELTTEIRLSYTNPPPGLLTLQGLEIPIKMSGDIRQPEWQVDVNKLLGKDNIQRLLKGISTNR